MGSTKKWKLYYSSIEALNFSYFKLARHMLFIYFNFCKNAVIILFYLKPQIKKLQMPIGIYLQYLPLWRGGGGWDKGKNNQINCTLHTRLKHWNITFLTLSTLFTEYKHCSCSVEQSSHWSIQANVHCSPKYCGAIFYVDIYFYLTWNLK